MPDRNAWPDRTLSSNILDAMRAVRSECLCSRSTLKPASFVHPSKPRNISKERVRSRIVEIPQVGRGLTQISDLLANPEEARVDELQDLGRDSGVLLDDRTHLSDIDLLFRESLPQRLIGTR